MKNVILILAVAVVASGATYWLVSAGKSSAKEKATVELRHVSNLVLEKLGQGPTKVNLQLDVTRSGI